MAAKLSSKVTQLAFMRKALDKARLEKAADMPAKPAEDERWVVEGAKDRCVVLMEGDPPIGTGRISFLAGNESVDPQRNGTASQEASGNEMEAQEGAVISDAAMAGKLSKKKKHSSERRDQTHGEQHDDDVKAGQKTIGFKKPREFGGGGPGERRFKKSRH